MGTILDLFAASCNAIGASIGRLVMAIGLFLVCVFGFVFMVFRLNLWATPTMWVGALFAWFGLWLGTILIDTGKPAKAVAIFCAVSLVGISFARLLPGTTEGGKTFAAYEDKQALAKAEKTVQEVPSKVRCDAGNMMMLVFFTTDGNTREKKNTFWYARAADGRIECYDRAGFDPVFGKTLEAVSESIVQQIAIQPPPEGPKPIATPEPVQVAVVAPPVPITVPIVVAPVAPVVQPTPEPTPEPVREYSTKPNATVTVALTEPLDVGEQGERFQFTGTLVYDITDSNGFVLAKSGAPVGMMIRSLRLDPRTNAAMLELEVTALTTTSGKAFPVVARHRGSIPVPPVRTGMKKNIGKGAIIGGVVGGIFGKLHGDNREAARYAAIGAATGASAGVALTKGQYILPPGQLQLRISGEWSVPATLVTAAR